MAGLEGTILSPAREGCSADGGMSPQLIISSRFWGCSVPGGSCDPKHGQTVPFPTWVNLASQRGETVPAGKALGRGWKCLPQEAAQPARAAQGVQCYGHPKPPSHGQGEQLLSALMSAQPPPLLRGGERRREERSKEVHLPRAGGGVWEAPMHGLSA